MILVGVFILVGIEFLLFDLLGDLEGVLSLVYFKCSAVFLDFVLMRDSSFIMSTASYRDYNIPHQYGSKIIPF